MWFIWVYFLLPRQYLRIPDHICMDCEWEWRGNSFALMDFFLCVRFQTFFNASDESEAGKYQSVWED